MTSTGEDDFWGPSTPRKKQLPREEIEKLQHEVRKRNEYSLEETKTRNVIIVGRTRSGKSTAVGVLKDPCHEPKEMSIFSDTVDPKFQSFALEDKKTATKYTINVVDTPGLKEVKRAGEDARSDEVILNTINYCLRNEITKINNLLIFVSFELGVTTDDLESFRSFLEKFSHDGIRVIICITRAEDKNEEWKEKIISQLNQHAYFKEVLAKPNVSVCFMGCVDQGKNQVTTDIDDLTELYKGVYRMRARLLKEIFESEQQVLLIDLPIACSVKRLVEEIFAQQFKLLEELSQVSDFNLAHVKIKVADIHAGITSLSLHGPMLLDPTFHTSYVLMKDSMQKVADKMDPESRSFFLSKIVG